jgi:hypothetical protein
LGADRQVERSQREDLGPVLTAPEVVDPAVAGDDEISCQAEEQAVLRDPRPYVESSRKLVRIFDLGPSTIEDNVSPIRDERLGAPTTRHGGIEGFQVLRFGRLRRGGNLHGKRESNAQSPGELRFVDDDDLAAAGASDDLLPQKRSAAALDQIQVRIDLVGAVDRQIDHGMCIERCERYPEVSRHRGDLVRARDGEDVGELSEFETLGDSTNSAARSAA